MEYTEGQITEADSLGIEEDTNETPRQKPWERDRQDRVRATYTNGRDNDPRYTIIGVGNVEPQRKFVLNKSLLKFSSQLFCMILVQNGLNQITDVASKHFECIVQYLFGHFIWTFTTMESACSQIEAANRYGLKALSDDLFEKLTQLVIKRLAVFNNGVACRAWVLFKTLDKNNMLAETARDYILKNAAEILRGDTFLDLSKNDLLDILKDDNLAVESELDVYKALIRWGAHNLKNRKQKCIPDNFRRIFTPLIPAVRFPNMTQSEFVNYVLPLEVLTATQTVLLNGSKGIELPKQPRRYLKPTEEKRTTTFPDEEDQLKLEKAKAEVYIARNEIENVKYNFNLDILQLREENAKQNSIMSTAINRAKDELLQENAKLEAYLLLPEVESLKTEIAQLRNRLLAPEREARLMGMLETQDKEILKLSSNSAFAEKALQHSLNFQKLMLERLPQAQKEGAKVMLNHAQDIIHPSEEFVCRVVLRNKTSAELTNPAHFFHSTACRECCPKPLEIPQNTTETFGFVCQKDQVAGLFSYQIRNKSFLVKYCAKNGYNDFVIGFAPKNISLNVNLLTEIDVTDWFASIDRRKVVVWTKDMTKDLKATVKMGDLRAVAAMTTGPNVVLSIVLENV